MACIEFTTTSACNYACTYCFEGHYATLDKSRIQKSKTQILPEEAVAFIYEYIDKVCPEEKSHEISFWGGEPFLNFDFIESVIKQCGNDRRFHFMMYTNGAFIKRYLDRIVLMAQACNQNLYIQISYDGVSHDKQRVDKGGRGTSKVALEAFDLLKKYKIPTGFKSVIMPETYKDLFDNFIDIAVTHGDHYNPSNDSHNLIDSERANKYLGDLKTNLAKIAKYIFDNGLELDKFTWFTESRKMCRAGYRFVTVDVDGTIFPCHGFMYIGDTHKIANIRDIDRIKKIQELSDEMEIAVKTQHPNGKCEVCDVRFCTRCPAGSATLSKDLGIDRPAHYAYINRFTCSVFKLSDRIAKALIYAKNRNRTN